MKFSGFFPALSVLAIGLAAGTTAASAQSRYAPPPAAVLSADLASPWILQLRDKPKRNGHYAVQIAPPLPPTRMRSIISAFTPLQADPVRRYARPSAPARVESASLGRKISPGSKAQFDPKYEMQVVAYDTTEKPGTIIVDTASRFLYLVGGDGTARRYGIGVGREGFAWSGTHKITRKAEWPGWTPPEQMIEREAARGHIIPDHMDGGPNNPLGARALYIGDTLYRIHGTNQPWSIGKAVSSGCIRMRNADVIDLFERVHVGSKVVVS